MPNFDKAGALVRNGRLYSFGVNLARLIKYKDTTVEHALDEHSDEIANLETTYKTRNLVHNLSGVKSDVPYTFSDGGIYRLLARTTNGIANWKCEDGGAFCEANKDYSKSSEVVVPIKSGTVLYANITTSDGQLFAWKIV